MSHPVPEIEQATTYTAVIVGEPVVILLPRMRATLIAESGALVSADAWTAAVTRHGAVPMLDLGFAADPVPGWSIVLDRAMTAARITGPAGLGEIYTGALEAAPDWRHRVAQRHRDGGGLVVITGRADRMDPEAAQEMMEQERAVWIRTRLVLGD
ncbi:hypothetical protein [Nocardia bovistercoris]|uniref:Uncharacterized protein n=1 Tax=Nocardia bovistercoris TaxID=2785916 RepID=A0A931IFJ3_9NOCA|nr:hypothetical protein [Nocardia bovistercoris]MBH0780371.1 hypothetical protein [Nocardia bovistercoris]